MPLAPYMAFAWAAPLAALPHVPPMNWFTAPANPVIIAHEMKVRADGQNVMYLSHAPSIIWDNPDDRCRNAAGEYVPFKSPWIDSGAAHTALYFDDFWPRFKEAGGKCDFFVTDAEVGFNMWALKPENIQAIGADRRYKDVGEKNGLPDLSATSAFSKSPDQWILFNAIMSSIVADGFHRGFYEPLVKVFPDAGYSEWADGYLPKSVIDMAPEYNGWKQFSLLPIYGSHQSPAYYHGFGQLAWEGRNDGSHADFTASPMPTLIWEVQTARAHTVASDIPQIPWISYKSYAGDSPDAKTHYLLANSPYYEEALWQILICSNATDVLFWNPKPQGQVRAGSNFDKDNIAIDAAMAEFATETDNAPTIHCMTLDRVPYNSKVVVSGAECLGVHGTRKLFRVTLAPGEKSATITLPGETAARTITLTGSQTGQWIVEDEGGTK